ncbi:glycoside hydrolase family 43 protein [Steroidobacter sp. S1-65]|uniref:Glycoside hydrolase family 43 protein n=2 Tax=Steroidobacter gossypii TaxID=2805490 RepID=A0ABS1WYU7_9GAMM|nr:glycoside hydrolase family 43 protein [Steroidobacter gossypii]MBM0106141.1 glycoside hydrolase family 43 protein [Steroidobacter gossypii]
MDKLIGKPLLVVAMFLAPWLVRAEPAVSFDWFEYTGKDAVFDTPLPAGSYRNPILAGFYPDPSVTRVGDKFYLVNSTFAYFPGIPVFESSDLVHWRLLGHVLERPEQLRFQGLGVSRGVFAPTIEHHDGVFYVLNTLVDSGGNFIVTAKSAAGPWSDPVWLPEIDGIDPSLFVDADGKAYVLNNGAPDEQPRYEGHRAVWMQEFDLKRMKLVGPRRVLVNGGVDISKKPIWIEGPHIFKRGDWYYLSCAEGGTSVNHSQVILRSKSVWGPYTPYEKNPILTQRDLPKERAHPIINAGHADLIEAPDGTWWATFLASRPYDAVNYNTGRETYLLPVSWQDDWPMILGPGKPIPYVTSSPKLPNVLRDAAALSGNFTWRDEFDARALDGAWLQVRAPARRWFDFTAERGRLQMLATSERLDGAGNPAYLGRRQQHLAFEASTALRLPEQPGVAAGIAAFQNSDYWYFLGARRVGESVQIFLEKKSGATVKQLATKTVKPAPRGDLELKIAGQGRNYSFYYQGDGCQALVENDDGSILSTEVAGGFVGATLGPHARLE